MITTIALVTILNNNLYVNDTYTFKGNHSLQIALSDCRQESKKWLSSRCYLENKRDSKMVVFTDLKDFSQIVVKSN